MSKSKLIWKGKETQAQIEKGLKAAIVEIDLRIEGEAKQELQPGHGVETGTMRRSVHAASADYNWSGDNVAASSGSPERGGQQFEPAKQGTKITGAVGTGVGYGIFYHQGHHSWGGHPFILNAYGRVQPRALEIVEKHVRGGG